MLACRVEFALDAVLGRSMEENEITGTIIPLCNDVLVTKKSVHEAALPQRYHYSQNAVTGSQLQHPYSMS